MLATEGGARGGIEEEEEREKDGERRGGERGKKVTVSSVSSHESDGQAG